MDEKKATLQTHTGGRLPPEGLLWTSKYVFCIGPKYGKTFLQYIV